ncbi:conserved hypothetical protein [uncultured Pleomorphomonas sp.]|uniref:Uncharacterized protein n=1 Tax=uncultured Pleomorphomonas sp. TaxID=442121 RepID=A0A212L7Y9_9HYPH|nr:hypothetical protein [uncultured Pleomorphomonas sp.]SCM73449.1 conserved hypothetical protein [uncultured Pleomorphomonas sp.]
MENLLRANLRHVSDAFSASTGYSEATICKRVFGSDRFLHRIEHSGSSFTVRTYDRAMTWFSANWPEGVAWPADVPRPAMAAAEASADE